MHEHLSYRPSEIITSPESLPATITYAQLVEKYGGKAAGLLWMQKHAPNIPTARMIVAPPGTEIEEIIDTAKAQGLKMPWIIRASTPLDDESGYEDFFPTLVVRSEDENYKQKIGIVKHSPFYKKGLPFEEATTLVAEYSPSEFTGTVIAHPHKDNSLMANVNNTNSESHAYYYVDETGTRRSNRLSLIGHQRAIPLETDEMVAQLADVYHQISHLPGIDQTMTYQIEFGLYPFMVFQKRDFLPKQKADFVLPFSDLQLSTDQTIPTVFGITPPEGIVVQVLQYSQDWHWDEATQSRFHEVRRLPFEPLPGIATAIQIEPRKLGKVKVPRTVNMVTYGPGSLAHDDIRTIRSTPLNIFNWDPFIFRDASGKDRSIQHGDIVRIFSDGERVVFEEVIVK